jgi:hypothetical protein
MLFVADSRRKHCALAQRGEPACTSTLGAVVPAGKPGRRSTRSAGIWRRGSRDCMVPSAWVVLPELPLILTAR